MIERVMLDLNRSEGIIGSAILDLNKGEVEIEEPKGILTKKRDLLELIRAVFREKGFETLKDFGRIRSISIGFSKGYLFSVMENEKILISVGGENSNLGWVRLQLSRIGRG